MFARKKKKKDKKTETSKITRATRSFLWQFLCSIWAGKMFATGRRKVITGINVNISTRKLILST